ncbi:mechanosensitive ion channel domain-containing protein [Pseudopedobacter beijingensis]|uniref:Mechanosensitive ion channel domain-containing protein n=1 Tax=Pseudopedobacter beijingensis TaxID=1207056 RepID=A0ABW4IF29_9SPHI
MPHKKDSVQTIQDTLLLKLQKAQNLINEVNASSKNGYALQEIHTDLLDIEKNIAPIREDLKQPNRIIDQKTLTGYNLILKKSVESIEYWRAKLITSNNELQLLSDRVGNLGSDSLLNLNSRDTSTKKLYHKQLYELKERLQQSGMQITSNLDTVSKALAKVSTVYFEITDLQASINENIKSSEQSSFRKESPYIWSAPKGKSADSFTDLLSSSFTGQDKILHYFIDSTWDNRILLLLLSGCFFFWVYFNFKKTQKEEIKKEIGDLKFDFIKPIPIISTLIVLFNLTALFEPQSPALYIEVMQFLLLMCLTVGFWKSLPKNELKYWLVIVVLYIFTVLATATVRDAFYIRIVLIALNIFSLYIGKKFYTKIRYIQIAQKTVKPILFIFLALNCLSIVLNIFGRISLASTFSTTAIIGLTQVIGLVAFILIIIDALELQIRISCITGGVFSRVNLDKARSSFKKILSLVAIILWLLVFLINLGISDPVFSFVEKVLNKSRTFGSISFTFYNILFFALILYISNWLQKNIEVIFGERSIGFSNEVEHRSSKLTLIRLIVAIVGVLLAIMASGIALDKLTVVLGALSVGIGLGMQNIVNNFVSGIILIFEKPFHIGDYVELADKKGKIKDIGIRASKMLTQQGAEVIIPNADLLSNRFVNWTTNKAYVRSEIILKVNINTELNTVNKIVEEEVNNSKFTVRKMPFEILINAVAADSIELKILVWIKNIYMEPNFKNLLFLQLINKFKENGIKIM